MMILLSQIWLKVMPFAFALAEGRGGASVRLHANGRVAKHGLGCAHRVSHSVGHVESGQLLSWSERI